MIFLHKQTRAAPLRQKKIRWRGKSWTLPDAAALVLRERQAGNLAAVVELLRLQLAQNRRSPELHNNLGAILQQMGRMGEALANYDKAIALKPDYANAHFNRGTVLRKLNRPADALESYQRAITLKPDHADAHNNCGIIFQEMRRYNEAVAGYEKAIAAAPSHAEAHYNLGTALMSLGRAAEAEKMFHKAAELKPAFAAPLFSVANLRKFPDANNADAEKIRAALARPDLSPEDEEHLCFALGKICDDCGRYEEAFGYFQRANEIRNRGAAYDANAVEKMTGGLTEVFSETFLRQPFAFASSNRAPVFIVGMPRSGTTLLANVLSNHPAVALAGELPAMDDLARAMGGPYQAYPAAARQLTAEIFGPLIAGYESRLRRDVGLAAPRVIDKNPLNFRHLGLIAMLFPHAKIFHCTRHPLDICLSNYFQRFPLTLNFSFDLRNLGHFFGQYARLMAHWRKIPAINLMDVSYEEMILDTEATARRALEFLELDWDARCLLPQTNSFPVENASQWQVRQPIYRDSIGRWRHYETQLSELKNSLRENPFTSRLAEW